VKAAIVCRDIKRLLPGFKEAQLLRIALHIFRQDRYVLVSNVHKARLA
jgi:hypothetical protein